MQSAVAGAGQERRRLGGENLWRVWAEDPDTAARAGDIWRKRLDDFSPPPLDDAIRAELDDYVTRRRRELGD